MSDKLVEMFKEKYPLTPRGYDRVSIYPRGGGTWVERIHLDLVEKEFLKFQIDKKPLADISSIKDVAKRVFDDIGHRHYTLKDQGNLLDILYFEPKGIDDYNQSYSNHFIEIREPLIIPKIMISTGNRGRIKLHERQREKYFQFVNDVYNLFMRNAKKRINFINLKRKS